MSEATGTFRWEHLGKPDYSMAASYVASLPKEVRNELNRSEELTLTKLFFLIWNGAAHSGRGTGYAIPSQGYLGETIGRSRFTISRALRVLCDMGLVCRKRRAPVQGIYQTCIYTAGKRLLASLYARFTKRFSKKNHVAEMPHNDLKKGNITRGAATPSTAAPTNGLGKSKSAPLSGSQIAFPKQQEETDEQHRVQYSAAILERIGAYQSK